MTPKIESGEANEACSVFDPKSWGLPPEVIDDLACRLRRLWTEFRPCFTTQTRDTSEYAYLYLRGLLTMDTNRNYANIARRVISPTNDGQNLQQFMSDSPWEAKAVFYQIQSHIASRPELLGGMLTLDESGFERAGGQSAGAERQYIGRLGKVELGQVAVALGYCQADTWSMVDAELFLPHLWFTKRYAQLRKRWHIPADRTFATKAEIGLEMIKQAQCNGLPFEIVSCDSFYGRDHTFRANLEALQILYLADVPTDTGVYLQKPIFGIPKRRFGKRGRPPTRKQVINGVSKVSVSTVAEQMEFQSVEVRATERGPLTSTCAATKVWTVTESGGVQKEWLFARQEPDESQSFSMSNAKETTDLKQLAFWRSQRYFAERTFQDAKTEAGWDELVARKYRAFLHHTAIDALALWFVTQTKLDWAQSYPRSESLAFQLEIENPPGLSMANIRELLKAVMPLEQLSPQQAIELVVRHLVNRSNSTRSRQNAHPQNPP
jgi:SRSO17 transposase